MKQILHNAILGIGSAILIMILLCSIILVPYVMTLVIHDLGPWYGLLPALISGLGITVFILVGMEAVITFAEENQYENRQIKY